MAADTDTVTTGVRTASSTTPTSGRLPGLDALRGFAIALVMLRHAFPAALGGAGMVGVTVFFTLSGFLITETLRREIDRTGSLSFRRFYRNRAVRLGPALLALLVVFALVEVTTGSARDRERLVPTVFTGLTFTADLPLGLPISAGMEHLWTLAVEEQFYLLWPVLLLFAMRRGRSGWLIVTAALLTSLVCAVTVGAAGESTASLYTLPTTWGIAFIIGGGAAVFREHLDRAIRGRYGAALALVVLCAFSGVPGAKEEPLAYLIGPPLVAAGTVVLIVTLSRWPTERSWPLEGFRLLGVVSYGAYLWNYLIVAWLHGGTVTGQLPWQQALWTVPLTLLAAVTSWHLVERPALRFKLAATAAPSPRSVGEQCAHRDREPALLSLS